MFIKTLRRGILVVGLAAAGLMLTASNPTDSFARQRHRGKVVRTASHSAHRGRRAKLTSKKHHGAKRTLNPNEKDTVIGQLQSIASLAPAVEAETEPMPILMQSVPYSLLQLDGPMIRKDVTISAVMNLPPLSLISYTAPSLMATKTDVINHMISWIGTPYVFGGASHSGIDCSAFTRTIYRESFGVDLPRTAYMQSLLGTPVLRNDLQFGDMVFFKTARYAAVTHVGIYVGSGLFANAQGSRGVTLASLSDPYWAQKFLFAKRLYSDTRTAQAEVNNSIDYAVASGALEADYHKYD